MRSIVARNKYFLILILIFIISEIIVNPIGEFPLNDDWSYCKSVLFTLDGNFTIGGFGAMTLFTHLMWGSLFAKIFGFSFTVLRFSTFVSVIISMFFMNKLIVKISNNPLLGFLACLVLLFNPLYFNLTNTYMTDVNFNTLLVLCSFCAYSFFQSKKIIYVILLILFSIALVLIRQFGIIVPVCFLMACLFLKENKIKYLVFALIGVAVVMFAFKFYENYLQKTLSPGSSYKFSGGIKPLTGDFWIMFFENLAARYRIVLLHILIYTMPLAIMYLNKIGANFKKMQLLFISAICFYGAFLLFKEERFPFHNVFVNISVGAETFHETLTAHVPHTFSNVFARIFSYVKWIFPAITLLAIILYIVSGIKQKQPIFKLKPEILFLAGLMILYTFMILITESYFDRYHIPLISISLILFAFVNKHYDFNFRWAIIPLLCFFYVSVFGTKDYLTLNRTRWEAFNYIKNKENTTAEKINGGFEVNCWNDAKNLWWYNYADLSSFDYLIQFKKEEGFKLLKAYEFQRYLPYKKDTVNLFIRENK
ncbi:MAG: hypothetical protein ABIP51_14935 [Bacteroidia bacterium]